jgi:hypothetical protein
MFLQIERLGTDAATSTVVMAENAGGSADD